RLIEVRKRISPAAIRRMKPGLTGEHQILNAACAIVTIDTLKMEQTKTFRRVGRKAIKAGLIRVQKNTGLHGRMEVLGKKKQYILDVAHNPAGLETLMNALPASIKKNLIVVFGVMRDKDYRSMCRTLALNATCVVSVQPQTGRALTSAEMFDSLKATGIEAIDGGSVRNGILVADSILHRKGKILVTGSHYVVGEALELLKSTGHVANA
ncbi:MAG: cyanophycin synthetase, partial [bacterium]